MSSDHKHPRIDKVTGISAKIMTLWLTATHTACLCNRDSIHTNDSIYLWRNSQLNCFLEFVIANYVELLRGILFCQKYDLSTNNAALSMKYSSLCHHPSEEVHSQPLILKMNHFVKQICPISVLNVLELKRNFSRLGGIYSNSSTIFQNICINFI